MPNPPADEDDWYFFAIGRWMSGHLTDGHALGRLFSEYGSAREPIFRPVTNLWFGLEFGLLGTTWWAWHLVNAGLHAVLTWNVQRLGLAIGLSARAAWLAALLFAVHPVQSETLAWINAQETQVMMVLVLWTVRASLAGRHGWAVPLALAAMLAKEQGIVAVGLALVAAFWGRRPLPLLALTLLPVGLAVLAWRALHLAEPDNAAHLEFIRGFVAPAEMARGLLFLAPVLLAPIVSGLGIAWIAATVWGSALSVALFAAFGSTPTGQVPWRALALGFVWAVVAVGPALADVGFPDMGRPPEVPVDWNFRHLGLALVGPALALGAFFEPALNLRWSRSVLAMLPVASALLLALDTVPYANLGARQRAGLSAVQGHLPENAGVRLVQPGDTITVALSSRRFADPSLPVVPVLIGEPRCGCATLGAPADARSYPTLRALSEAYFAARMEDGDPVDVGGACTCARLRADAVFFRLEGPLVGPFRLVPDA